jgi:curved DNA-binding protein CbpA
VANHYEVLGVPQNAPADAIRKAYLKLARERHPDRFTDPAEKQNAQAFFQALTDAFNTLSNDRRRREYDAELSKPKLETPEEIARDAFARAQKSAEERDLQAALELLKVAVHHMPQEAKYHAAMGRVQAQRPEWVREAIQSLEKAVQLSPENAALHGELATLLSAQGLKLRARKVLESARRLLPGDAGLLRLAAELGLEEPAGDKPPASGPMAGLKGIFGRKS